MDEFKVGDIVKLKSGGPSMTVVVAKGGKVRCFWFVEPDPKRRAGTFPVASIEPVS